MAFGPLPRPRAWAGLPALDSGLEAVLEDEVRNAGPGPFERADVALRHAVAIVVEDAVGDRALLPHLASLFDIQAKYGDVVPLGAAIAYLEGLAPAEADA